MYKDDNKQTLKPKVPYGIDITALWAWKLSIIIISVSLIFYFLSYINFLLIPIMIAMLLASLLIPIVNFFIYKLRLMPIIAVLLIEIGLIFILLIVLCFIWRQFFFEFTKLQSDILDGVDGIKIWLLDGPLNLTDEQIRIYVEKITSTLHSNTISILNGALSIGNTAGHIFAGIILTFFSLIFFLLEGEKIWNFIINLLPKTARFATDYAGRKAWDALSNYTRIQILVALIDGIGIGISALIIGIPLAFPLAILVIIGSFVPVVGAFITGLLAVLLSLITKGIINALIMLLLVILVQQIESHILQPLMMSKAISLHPLSVVLSVMAGSVLGGITGALFALPILVITNSFIRSIANKKWSKLNNNKFVEINKK